MEAAFTLFNGREHIRDGFFTEEVSESLQFILNLLPSIVSFLDLHFVQYDLEILHLGLATLHARDDRVIRRLCNRP